MTSEGTSLLYFGIAVVVLVIIPAILIEGYRLPEFIKWFKAFIVGAILLIIATCPLFIAMLLGASEILSWIVEILWILLLVSNAKIISPYFKKIEKKYFQ